MYTPTPECVPLPDLDQALREHGYAVMDADAVSAWIGCSLSDLLALQESWNDLPADAYLKDGGRYRRRRHASFVVKDDADALEQVPHRAHWQPLNYNALHGGMHRWFEPVQPSVIAQPVWRKLLCALGKTCSTLRAKQHPWFVEAHQFRIDTTDGIGRPTPEGAHRDGVDMVAVFLLGRHGIKGGETRVFDAHGTQGRRFTLAQPWSVLLLDDQRVIHETTPIQPVAENGWRDTLVLTSRCGGFLDEDA